MASRILSRAGGVPPSRFPARRKPPRAPKRRSAGASTLPAEIEARIDAERRKLMQACELLAALAVAYDNDPDGCDYADVALAVRDMIDKAVAGIDPTALRLLISQRST